MVNVTELRPGNYFLEDNNIFKVLDILLNKTAMRKMVAKVKVKNMRTGAVTEIAHNSGFQIDVIRLDKKQMSFLYDDGNSLVFMDQVTYDQIELPKETLTWEQNFLKGDEVVEIQSYENEVLGINMPAKVALKVTQCDPATRGDTINKAMKEVTLETGFKTKVPMFIEEGETVLIRTDNGEYDGRAN